MKPRHLAGRTARYAFLAILGLALALPFVAFALNAFSRQWFYPQLLPKIWSLDAWRRIFSARSQVPEALLNSVVIALNVTLVSIVIGLPAARSLGMYRFRGKGLVEFLIFLPTMVPPLTVGMGLSLNFLRSGLGGTMLGVALVHLVPVMPYVVLTLAGVFANYNVEYEEQARTLGAGSLAVMRHVTLPAIFPGLVVAGLFAFLISWSQYILTFLIGAGRIITMPVLLFSSVPGGDNPNIAAQSLLFVGPALLILLLTSRYLSGEEAAVQGFGRL
ncbi:MAG: ABC transporter permease [Chloroflexi bacterium]|nr:ABC transporter permease [Chloroflexota bacterium]